MESVTNKKVSKEFMGYIVIGVNVLYGNVR